MTLLTYIARSARAPWLHGTLAAALLTATGCVGRSMFLDHARSQGKVIREYEEGSDTFVVVHAKPNRLQKWRVADNGAALVYEADEVTRVCKSAGSVIPCDGLKRDPDFTPFIRW